MPGPEAEAIHEPQAEIAPPPPVAAEQSNAEQEGLLFRMSILEPGDFKAVASLIEMHPEMRDAIIARAQEICGNETVTKALESLEKTPDVPEAAPENAAAEPPKGEAAVEVAAAEPAQAPPEEFEYILSPLALEPPTVQEHVAFIRTNPHLRDKVLTGAAEFNPALAAEVAAALEGEPAQEAVPAPPSPEVAEVAPQQQAAPAAFEYILSPLALEPVKVEEHVDFIRANPHLRDQVLIGVAEFDAAFAEEVRAALEEAPAQADVEAPVEPQKVEADLEAASEVAPAQTAEATPEPTPGWVVRARAYNQRHAALVAEFNELTRYACVGPMGWIEGETVESMEVDPYLVAQWQSDAGLAPDGRVGPATVDAAKVEIDTPAATETAVATGEPPPEN